ncbi:MAG: cryptochrome/photolyase family protein [Rhodothermia bacterium]|nr:cryptochrome/photolyase family protein [Rhodothermia bacterium]
MATRYLIPVFGDQLSRDSRLLESADPEQDVIVMAEVRSEILRYRNHKQRVILFLAAMRHFRDDLREHGFNVVYQEFDDNAAFDDLPSAIRQAITDHSPDSLLMLEPGNQALEEQVIGVAEEAGLECTVLDDDHFFCTRSEFADWAEGRSGLVMEHFYRMMRRKTGYLMDGDQPAGDEWNYDADNRESFGKNGPGEIEPPPETSDEVTGSVSAAVDEHLPDLPGHAEPFRWPVTPSGAKEALARFVDHHLPSFGPTQDAMWSARPYLHHSLLSSSINLKLLSPREAIEAAIGAYERGDAPIQSVEGFVRQLLGWREFMRGIYWLNATDMGSANFFDAAEKLPDFFWSGQTEMACLKDVVTQLKETAYAHHIQRLMVAGLFNLLYGTDPKEVHDWFMAFYVDSVEWVTLPNTVGMSQFADGGNVATKPYIASGKYINRMSNYCADCRFKPDEASGGDSCPFTTLYWDFIRRHESYLNSNGRTRLQVRNYDRKSGGEKAAITRRANEVREMVKEGNL